MKNKIICNVLAIIAILAFFTFSIEDAPIWLYLVSVVVIYFCFRDIHRIDPNFGIEYDGHVIE